MQDQITARLTELREEFHRGQAQLADLDAQQARLRETLLRIAGAIQVLEEMLPPEAAEEDPAAALRVTDAE